MKWNTLSLNISHFCINSFFYYWSIKVAGLPLHFITVSEDLALGHLVKVMSVSVPMHYFPICARWNAGKEPFHFLTFAKCLSVCFPLAYLELWAVDTTHYFFLWEAICITEPGTVSSTSQWVTLHGRSWSCRTGLTQPRGLWLQRWTCTDTRAGSKCCPGQRGMKDESSGFGFYFKSWLQWSLLKAERRKGMALLSGATAAPPQLIPVSWWRFTKISTCWLSCQRSL